MAYPVPQASNTIRYVIVLIVSNIDMSDIATFIASRFPTHEIKVCTCYENDEDFRGLCEDFHFCVKMLEKDQKAAKEFQALASDLENEIATFLTRPLVRRA
jgi:hypothetical protein